MGDRIFVLQDMLDQLKYHAEKRIAEEVEKLLRTHHETTMTTEDLEKRKREQEALYEARFREILRRAQEGCRTFEVNCRKRALDMVNRFKKEAEELGAQIDAERED